ncbi:centromere protein F [Heptranchias perlo]|uniref:centromere protein F n=1 Tax=Heptranchias perlo TaxID=212740 RepID=UPI003559E600
MSWVVEEWKEGLPTKALQKIQEIETQLDKLKKERQQRQFQLESLEAALLKQKQKVENEKTETSALKREHQSLLESCENLEKTRQKISHDLQVKESQVNYLEGQLASSKKQVENLEQENKRYKSELERSQQTLMPTDVQSRTPQRNLSGSMTPNQNIADKLDSKLEELQEKYSKEVEERRRLETELKIIQAKLINQTQPHSTINHRNIARKQSSSSVFPWQQDQTPSQQASHSLETPLKRGVAMNIEWEQEETPFKYCSKSLQKSTRSTGWFNNSTDSSKQEEQLKSQNQELQTKVLDLEFRLQAQEKEIKNHMNKLHEIQFQFEKAKADLSEKERNLNKCRDELTKVTAQYEQTSTKCVMVEQKLKQVSDELSCYRQNADSTRCNLEQKLKDKEKDFQQELSHQKHSLQSLDQQFSQMKNKLNQELQQAKNDYNVLQSEIDKVSAQKQKLERELDEIRQKLCRSDQMLKANQTKENDLKKKLEDIQKERNCHSNQLEQNSTQIHQLEDELKKTKQDFNHTWNFGEEMKSKNTAQETELKSLRQKLDEQSRSMCVNTENLKQQIFQLKMEHDSALKDMKEKERNIEQLNVQVGTMENEFEELQKNMQLKEKAFQELKGENSSLTQWKVENVHFVDNFKCEKEGIENKIKELEQSLEVALNKNQEQEQNLEVYQCKSMQQSEKLKLLEDEKENLQRQIDNLKHMLDNKTSELETQKQTFEELMKKARQEEQKHGKDVENLSLNISQLTSQIAELEKNLQQETNTVEKLEESQRALKLDYENVSNLAKSKDCLIEQKETEILNLKDSISQITHNLEEQLAKVEAEKNNLIEEYRKSMLDKVEVENAKSTLENYQQDISAFKEQIISLESSLKLEKHLRSETQNKYETLLKLREELEEKIEETEKKHENSQTEVEQEIHQLKMTVFGQREHVEALQATIDEKDKSIQNFAQELESNVNNLKCLQITNKELETKLEVSLQSEKCIQEKEELISLKENELVWLSEENEELKASINTLMQENMELNKKNSSFADVLKINEAMLQEQTTKYEEAATKEIMLKNLCGELTEKQRLLENTVAAKESDIKQLLEKMNEKETREDGLMHQYAALEGELKNLQEMCSALEENKDFLEMQLSERSKELLIRNAEVEELERKHTEGSADYNAKVIGYEEKVKAMIKEIGDLQTQLEKMEEIDHLKKELSESYARQNKMQEDHNELLQEKEQLTSLITKQEREFNDLRGEQAEKETVFATKMEKLESDLSIVQSENIKNSELIAEKNLISDQLKDTMITKEIELQRLQVQLQLLQMDLEDKEASLQSCISQMEQMQIDNSNVESKFQHCEEKRILLEKELSTMQAEMEAMQLKFSESKNHEESLLGQITLQRQTIEELKSEFEKQKEDLGRLHSLENQLNESQTKFKQKAEEQCQLREKEILELQEKLFQSESQISDLMSRNSDIESRMDSLQQELKVQMQIALSSMENTLQQSEEQRALVQKDLNKVQSELSTMHLHFIEKKNREESLMEQIALQRRTIEDLKSELERSKEQEVQLLHSLENMKNQLNASQINSKQEAEEEYRLKNKEILELGESFSLAQLQLNDLIIQCPLESSQQKLKNECENIMQHENKETPAEKYTVLLREFSSCQLAKENLEASLQQADKRYEDLENASKTMQHEKTLLTVQLDNLIPCIGICGKNSCLAEKKRVLTNETRHSGVEKAFLQTELERLNAENESSNTCPGQNENIESIIISDELQQCIKHQNPSYDDLKHSNEQLKEQVMKIKQKLFSYQHQNGKLHEQHCNTVSKVSELQSIIAALETEKASLLTKVDLTQKNIDLDTEEYKDVKGEMIVSQETGHQNIPEEKEMADHVENDSSGGKKNFLNAIEKSNDAMEELKAELSLLQSNLIEAQAALSGTKIEKVTLQAELRVLESSLESAHLHVSEQKECLQQLEKMIQEKDSIILLHQQLKKHSTNLTVNDQAIFSIKDTHLKMKTVGLETCSVTSEQTMTLLREQLQKQQDTADEEIQELHQTLTATNQEKKVQLLEEEMHHLCNELKSSALENQNLSDKAKSLEEEFINVGLQLQVDKVKLSDATKMLESLEMDKRERNEQFLELKNELKRAKSDKGNLEKHILEMEVDLDELQIRKHTLEKELESSQKGISVQTEKLTELETENNGVIQELSTLAETNNELEQTCKRLKTKVQELEAEKIYTANTIGVLEAEVKKQISQLQTAVEQMEKVSKEKEDVMQQFQYLEKNAMLDTEGREAFQKQLNQLKEENVSVLEQTEAMQNKLNVIELEKLKLLQSLESSLLEKSEVAARLNSTKAEVVEMRYAIEKLKVRIEADLKKSQHMAEKLKVSDRKADSLQDKIEALERELQASEENMEDIVLQAETAKEQVEILEEEKKTITEKLELLAVDLNTFSTEKQDLEKQLQQSQEKLEIHCSNLSRNSEAAESENLKMAEAYESSITELQSQINHLNEKVKVCNEELEKLREKEKNYLDQNSCLECENVQLSNQLHEADRLNMELQSANTILSKDLQEIHQQLDEHIEKKEQLQQQIADVEQLKQQDSKDLCNLQIEMENLKKEHNNLQMAAAESQQAAQDLSAEHTAMQVTKENSEKQLQNELQIAQLQASALLSQVNDLKENNSKQQDDLSIANENILKMQQEFDAEKNLISAQLEEFRSQAESFKLQLEISQSEKYKLEKDVGYFQNELQITDVLKKEIEEHKQRLKCIQDEHQAVLKDLQDQRDYQVQSYTEKMAGMEQQLTAQDVEINNLKIVKEEVNVALKDATCKVDELQKSVSKLKRDKDCAQNKLLLWMKSCKQLEHEKESLKKHIQQQEELFTKLQKSQKLVGPDSQVEELRAEKEELKETLEEITKEADENMEKYWNLIKSNHKLEEENEMLKSRVVLLNNKLQQPNSQDANSIAEQNLVVTSKSAAHKKHEKKSPVQSNSQQKHLKSPDVSSIVGLSMDAPMKLAVSKSHKRSPDSQFKLTTKRLRGAESKEEQDEMNAEALPNSSKRTRSGEAHEILLRSAAQDETSYEPEGLPHMVKKGFADIPSVSLSPYILRKTTLLNRASSDLAAQSRISPHRQSQQKGVAQTSKKPEMTAEGTHAQQHPAESTCSSPAVLLGPIPAMAESPLSSLTNNMGFETPGGKQTQKSRRSLNTKKSVEKQQHKEQTAVTKENENCKVQ